MSPFHGLESKQIKGRISTAAPQILAYLLQSLRPILHITCPNSMISYSKGSRGLFVPSRVIGIFTAYWASCKKTDPQIIGWGKETGSDCDNPFHETGYYPEGWAVGGTWSAKPQKSDPGIKWIFLFETHSFARSGFCVGYLWQNDFIVWGQNCVWWGYQGDFKWS